MTSATAIVVFDGECGLCNGFVAWLIRHDHQERFLIAGSAGEPGRATLEAAGLPPSIAASSLVVWDGAHPHVRSAAVLRIVAGLGRPWSWLRWFRAVPLRWRDAAYDAVARRRPRASVDDPACGNPPPALVREWRRRLATPDDVARVTLAGQG